MQEILKKKSGCDLWQPQLLRDNFQDNDNPNITWVKLKTICWWINQHPINKWLQPKLNRNQIIFPSFQFIFFNVFHMHLKDVINAAKQTQYWLGNKKLHSCLFVNVHYITSIFKPLFNNLSLKKVTWWFII